VKPWRDSVAATSPAVIFAIALALSLYSLWETSLS